MQFGEVAITFLRVVGMASQRVTQTSIFADTYDLLCLTAEKRRRDRFNRVDSHGTYGLGRWRRPTGSGG